MGTSMVRSSFVWRSLVFLLMATMVVLGFAGQAAAHDPGTTVVELELTETGIEITIDMPIDELGQAIGEEVATEAFALSQMRDPIVDYIDARFDLGQAGGSTVDELAIDVRQLTVIQSDGRQYLRASVSTTPTTEILIDGIVVYSDLIVEHDDTHAIVVTTIATDGTETIAGILDADVDELLVLSSNEPGASFAAILGHGFDHVLDGADHLLFLVALLLPAPLVAVGRRWESAPGVWHGLKRVIHVATAFTIGHSISLVMTALGFVSLPSRQVEIAIAFSVLVSAAHAARPLTNRGEIPIAAGFGLVHGVAFAEILGGYGLEGSSTLITLLAFNLGVEAAQLVTIGVAFPSLWLLAHTRYYTAVRMTGAGIAGALAVAWVVERLELGSNPFATVEQVAIDHLLILGIGLAVTAAFIAAIAKRPLTPEPLGNAR